MHRYGVHCSVLFCGFLLLGIFVRRAGRPFTFLCGVWFLFNFNDRWRWSLILLDLLLELISLSGNVASIRLGCLSHDLYDFFLNLHHRLLHCEHFLQVLLLNLILLDVVLVFEAFNLVLMILLQ